MSEARPYPYPYRAALAVCSDLDETPDRRVYEQIARYLNTTADTAMGPGLGLEVGKRRLVRKATLLQRWIRDHAVRAWL